MRLSWFDCITIVGSHEYCDSIALGCFFSIFLLKEKQKVKSDTSWESNVSYFKKTNNADQSEYTFLLDRKMELIEFQRVPVPFSLSKPFLWAGSHNSSTLTLFKPNVTAYIYRINGNARVHLQFIAKMAPGKKAYLLIILTSWKLSKDALSQTKTGEIFSSVFFPLPLCSYYDTFSGPAKQKKKSNDQQTVKLLTSCVGIIRCSEVKMFLYTAGVLFFDFRININSSTTSYQMC